MSAIGDYDRLVSIKMRVEKRDDSGAVIPNAREERCRVWAHRTYISGTEKQIGHEPSAVADYAWHMWWRTDIERTDVLTCDGEEYEILDVQLDRCDSETMLKTRLVRPQ